MYQATFFPIATPSAMDGVSPVTKEWASVGFGSNSLPAATAVPGTATAAVRATATTTLVRFFMQASQGTTGATLAPGLRPVARTAGAATLASPVSVPCR